MPSDPQNTRSWTFRPKNTKKYTSYKTVVYKLLRKEDLVITRHGKPAGILIGFKSEEDWFDYRLENDPRFLSRVESARRSLRAGKGDRLEELDS